MAPFMFERCHLPIACRFPMGRRAGNFLNMARQGGEATDRIAGCRLEAAKP